MISTSPIPRINPAPTVQAPVPADPPVVRATGLGKRMDGRAVLSGVNLEVAAGSILALLGANGAGKSTLLRILAMLTPPTAGTLELFGRPGVAADLRSRVGLIGHQPMLYRDLSARENLEFFGRLYAVRDVRQRASELLEALGLADRAADPVRSLSRGMAQRASIARALMHAPRLLLADEPFAGLDAPSIHLLERRMDDLRIAGVTVVLASHDVRQSLAIADRTMVLRAGRVALEAPAAAVDARAILDALQGGAP